MNYYRSEKKPKINKIKWDLKSEFAAIFKNINKKQKDELVDKRNIY